MLTTTADRFYTLRFLRLLTTQWKDTNAFKAGLIDDLGNVIRKPKTSEEKKVYNMFHKLVFNIKRLLNKLPFGKTKLASYAAALLLLKDHTEISDEVMGEVLQELFDYNPAREKTDHLAEARSFLLNEDHKLAEGIYEFCEETLLLKNGNSIEGLGRKLQCTSENASPAGYVFNIPVFRLKDVETGATVLASNTQLTPLSI